MKIDEFEKLRILYNKKDEVLSEINRIEESDPNYTYNKFYYEYDAVNGIRWNHLQHLLNAIMDNIFYMEHKVGVGVFNTSKGLAVVTLKGADQLSVSNTTEEKGRPILEPNKGGE